ncbi:MAG: FKBP-type peptidyl-prolyl cis-trans isomerase [Holophaga sp.]|nr:FKBP-type peptidyl-prolyl cis-trans isomerase [Holophaga sp.]
MRLSRLLLGALALALLATPLFADRKLAGTFTKTASGLQIAELKPGKGPGAAKGQTLGMLYRGWLYDTQKGRQGQQFDANLNRNKPLEFELGAGRVIKGWDEGVAGMKKGGKRVLIIPPELAYGDRGAGGVIPPGATLLFEVEVVSIQGEAKPIQ